MKVRCATSVPFFPFTLDVVIPASRGPQGAPQSRGPLGVAAHDWVAPDVGYIEETEEEKQERELRQMQMLLSPGGPPSLPAIHHHHQQQQHQQQQQQQQTIQEPGMRGTALLLVDRIEDLFVSNIEGVPTEGGPLEGPPLPPMGALHGVSLCFLEGPQTDELLLRMPAYERWR